MSCHALRVWERRYGFPRPTRSAAGQRRYSKDQVEMLCALAKLSRSGRAIGELIGDYQSGALVLGGLIPRKVEEKPSSTQVIDWLCDGDLASADMLLDRLSERFTDVELIEQVIEPALVDVGDRRYRGECELFQEHCAVSSLFNRLASLLDRTRRQNSKPSCSVLVGAVRGDRHEEGVLMYSLALELIGWRAIPMGVDLPVDQFRKAVKRWRPDALCLSFVLSGNINKRFKELSEITEVPVFVGGRSIVNHKGLARRHGLIPLSGSLTTSVAELVEEFASWARQHGRPTCLKS